MAILVSAGKRNPVLLDARNIYAPQGRGALGTFIGRLSDVRLRADSGVAQKLLTTEQGCKQLHKPSACRTHVAVEE